jgi:hypothetical protein
VGEVRTVAEAVPTRFAPTPPSMIEGVKGKAGVTFASVKVALKFPRATGLN